MVKQLFQINPQIEEFRYKVIYGAGKEGRQLCERLKKEGLDITSFADSNKQLQGQFIMDKKVLSLNELKNMNQQTAILLSCGYEEEIYGLLKKRGINHIFLSHVDNGLILND